MSSLEIPPEDAAPKKEESKSAASEAPEAPKSAPPQPPKPSTESGAEKSAGTPQKQKYPLYPSVEHLLHENGLSDKDANKIPASGPNGRLLKGDVLAYLGRIDKSYSAEQSKRIDHLAHLDLSNIKPAAPKKAPAAEKPAAPAVPEVEPDTELAVPISLSAVLACQKRVQDTLGINLPLTTLFARAVEMANDDLPRSKASAPSADELFNAVLGLDKVSPQTSRGHFIPQVTPLQFAAVPTVQASRKQPDVIDILTGKSPVSKKAALPLAPASADKPTNVFSVIAAKGDEKRAAVFLDKLKLILEAEPGRLVL